MKNKFLLVACASAMMCGTAAASRAAEVVVDDGEADAAGCYFASGSRSNCFSSLRSVGRMLLSSSR